MPVIFLKKIEKYEAEAKPSLSAISFTFHWESDSIRLDAARRAAWMYSETFLPVCCL